MIRVYYHPELWTGNQGARALLEVLYGRKKEIIVNDIKNCQIDNAVNTEGNPTGGYVTGIGLSIAWQNGPLGRPEERQLPNGAFVETVISAAVQRLEFFQIASEGKFKCRENALAITKLEEALHWLEARTRGREERKVEGTHSV